MKVKTNDGKIYEVRPYAGSPNHWLALADEMGPLAQCFLLDKSTAEPVKVNPMPAGHNFTHSTVPIPLNITAHGSMIIEDDD